ncbi:hypothetical protein AKJ09_09362 [Labilithrix luteola]|uniref:Uncharacterized protein n=1 Tax=Labilithrix luteola TaxID=1391654 RepID=A0A0K1QAC7_9BACT|nr:hypothetical protein AKJ09_09362 [Labilithrix luteola]
MTTRATLALRTIVVAVATEDRTSSASMIPSTAEPSSSPTTTRRLLAVSPATIHRLRDSSVR